MHILWTLWVSIFFLQGKYSAFALKKKKKKKAEKGTLYAFGCKPNSI